MLKHLAACPSAEHRALLGLLAPALGHSPAPGLEQDLKNSDAVKLADAAQSAYVQTLVWKAFRDFPDLQACIPEDLLIFFEEMRRGNGQYNQLAQADLARAGDLLAAEGLRGCILKGGAELVAPSWDDPADRFIGDLDILVDEPAGRALETLMKAGAICPSEWPIDPEEETDKKHYPAIALPDSVIEMELHSRLVDLETNDILEPAQVLDNAQVTGLNGILVPTLRDRILHHVIHAQVNHRAYRNFDIQPRSIIDHAMLLGRLTSDEKHSIRETFVSLGLNREFDTLDALTDLILYGHPPKGEDSDWIDRALLLYGQPDLRWKTETRKFYAALVWRALFHKPSRQRYWRLIRSPRELMRVWRHSKDKIRHQTR